MKQTNIKALAEEIGSNFDTLIDVFGKRIKTISERIADLQLVKDELLTIIDDLKSRRLQYTGQAAGQEDDEAPPEQRGTHFDRIAEYLRIGANEPKTMAEISEGTGIARASISAVVYRTHADEFVRHEPPQGSRIVSWSLADYTPPEPKFLPDVDIPF
jgi:hypothetical protein